jgi:hypothetical protein
MPEYLSILRDLSVASIYLLFLLVLIYTLIKGKFAERELTILFYVWLPIAVITQFLMTYFRLNLHISNLPIMNIYLMIELALLVTVLLQIRKKLKNIEIDVKPWVFVLVGGVIVHFFEEFDSIHNAAMLYIAVVYFQLTIGIIDISEINKFLKSHYAYINLAIFIKAFGYSYFLVYQTDYTFPLIVYSGVNLLVQLLLALSVISYYKYKHEIAD